MGLRRDGDPFDLNQAVPRADHRLAWRSCRSVGQQRPETDLRERFVRVLCEWGCSTAATRPRVGTPKDEADDYLDILAEMADASGGGTLTPPRTVHDCRDHEDNLVLDLAAEVGALLLVSDDADVTSMSPWRGIPVLRAAEFTGRVAAC